VVGIVGSGFSLGTTMSPWVMAPWLFVHGMGVGTATAQLTGVILAAVPVEAGGQWPGRGDPEHVPAEGIDARDRHPLLPGPVALARGGCHRTERARAPWAVR
jgi:hypothetical protein